MIEQSSSTMTELETNCQSFCDSLAKEPDNEVLIKNQIMSKTRNQKAQQDYRNLPDMQTELASVISTTDLKSVGVPARLGQRQGQVRPQTSTCARKAKIEPLLDDFWCPPTEEEDR